MMTEDRYWIRDSGLEIRDVRHEKIEVRNESLQSPVHGLQTRIQDSFAGYKFDDVIRMDEEEKAEKKKLEDMARQENARRKSKAVRGKKKEETLEDKPPVIKNSKIPIYKLEEEDDCYKVIEELSGRKPQKYFFSKELLPPKTYNDWMNVIIWGRQNNLLKEYTPASSLEIHLLAKVAHHYKQMNDHQQQTNYIGEQVGHFLANAIKNEDLGAYTRIHWKDEPLRTPGIVHSECLPRENRRKIAKHIIERAERQVPISLNDNSIEPFVQSLFNDTSQNVLEVYRWIGEICHPRSSRATYIGTEQNKYTLPSSTIPSYYCGDKNPILGVRQDIEFVIQLTTKILIEEFSTIGVRRE